MNEREPARLHREIEIRIPGRPPTPNVRRHWRSIARDNHEWKGNAHFEAAGAKVEWQKTHGLRWTALDRAVVEITFVVGTKARRDLDNLIGTLKPLLDGIVQAGVLTDDSTDVIPAFGIRVEYRKGETSVIFAISEPIE